MSIVRNKSQNAKSRTHGDASSYWLRVEHRGTFYHIPSCGYWGYINDAAGDDKALCKALVSAVKKAVNR